MKAYGAFRQIIASDEPQAVAVSPGIDGFDLEARGGNLVIFVDEAAKILPAGHRATIMLGDDAPAVSFSLDGEGPSAMLQIMEFADDGQEEDN